MGQLRLFVFGPPRLERDDGVLELGLRRGLALLIYLAVTGQAHSHDALATLLWPEYDQRDARANLRRTLHRLGQAIGDEIIAAGGETIGLAPAAPLWVDCLAFSALSGSADGLEQAAQIYRDDFLAGFSLPDSPVFDEWQFFERERLRQLLAQNLEALARRAKARGAWDEAAEHARRWVAMDPLHEPAQRVLLEAYAQAGQAAAAVRQYQELARALEAELGAEPEEATTALYEAVRTRRLAPLANAGADAPEPAKPAAEVSAAPPPLFPSLPPLIGRERELAEIVGLLTVGDGPQLVTIAGPGGAGKTRLALAVAEAAGGAFADGVHFIALAEVPQPEGLVPAIAAGLGLARMGGDIQARLATTLAERGLLLILDNFEHLVAGAAHLAALLASAPRARVLVTSRERLGIGAEAVYPLGGLELPGADAGAQGLAAPAAQLLLQRARLVRPEVEPGPAEAIAILRICQMVQGMPLALNLAASWAELLPFEAIADEIARSLDFLSTEQADVPERQRSVRAVFESSWQRLPAHAQRAFARLTVFRGGFTREAAEAVADADLRTLRRLVSSSFITLSATAQRYEIHELLRQLGAEQLAGTSEGAGALRKHSAHYLARLRELAADLTSSRQQQAYEILRPEYDNLQLAWQTAVAADDREAIADTAEGLWMLGELRGAHAETERLFAEAAAAEHERGRDDALCGFLLAASGYFAARNDRVAAGAAQLERGVAILRETGPEHARQTALALLRLGFVARMQERYLDAERLAEESLARFAELDNQWGSVYSLLLMGQVAEYRGRPGLARHLLQACLDRAREMGELFASSLAAQGLGRTLAQLGSYAEARRHVDAALTDAERMGDPVCIGAALHERGRLQLIDGATGPAAESFEAGFRVFARLLGTWEAVPGNVDRAFAAALRGETAMLERAGALVLQAAQGTFERWHVARMLNLVGQLADERGELQLAARLHRKALRLGEAIGHEPVVAAAAARLGALAPAIGLGASERRRLLQQALELALRHQLAPIAIEVGLAAGQELTEGAQQGLAAELHELAARHPASPAAVRARAVQHGEAPPTPGAGTRGLATDWRGAAQRLLAALAAQDQPHLRSRATNLDAPGPPLIGRDYELARLAGLLGGPDAQLITLLGPGGIGKSRLAQEAGLVALDSFPDGVFFVPLAPLAEPDAIAPAILEQLGLPVGAAGVPREQLVGYLRDRRLLLILDNFEHLRAGAELLSALRSAAPGVQLLVTSRERLGLDGEVVLALRGIEVPEGEGDELILERGAVRLLLDRVRAVRPGFDLTPSDIDAMARIARLVQGMPLALILAASWADMLTLDEVAAEIARSLDVLEADLQALPPRQRSVRAVFEASWGRLTPAAQIVFARLSVFRGGFSRRAAQSVAGADLRTLRVLVDSSFITLEGNDRYDIHELLRQLGAERLAALGGSGELIDRHSDHYLRELAGRLPDLKGAEQLAAYAAIEQDLDNLRQAWEWALQRRNGQAIGLALDSLFEFSERRGRFRDGAELIAQARAQLAPGPEDGPLWPRLTIRLALLRSRLPRDQQVPMTDQQRCLQLAEQAQAVDEAALAHLVVGLCYARADNDYARALTHFQQAYALHVSLGDRYYQAEDLARIGICYGYLGDSQSFYQRCLEGYTIAEAASNLVGMVIALTNQSEALLHLGRYDEVVTQGARLIELGDRLGMRGSVNTAMVSIALAHLLRGDLDQARRVAVQGHQLSAAINNGLCAGLALGVLSLQAGTGEDYTLGLRYADEGLAQPLNLVAQVEIFWGRALAQCGLSRYPEAHASLRKALDSAGRFASPAPRVWLLPLLAVVLRHRGRAREAAGVLALASTHPLRASGWAERWRLLGRLRPELEHELGAEGFAAAWEWGRGLSVEGAAALLDGPSLTRAI